MRVVSAETTLARYRSRASRGGTMFPHVPPPVSDGIAAAKIAQKRNRTAKPKRQKPRLIRLRAVCTKPSREDRDYRVHCPCPAGVPGGAAPWRLLVTFRRRKVTPAPAGATLPICMGKPTMRLHCRNKENSPVPSSNPPAPVQGANPPLAWGKQQPEHKTFKSCSCLPAFEKTSRFAAWSGRSPARCCPPR